MAVDVSVVYRHSKPELTPKSPSLSVGILRVESALRYGCSWPFALELWQSAKFWVLSGYTKNWNAKVLGFAGLDG